MNLHLDTADFYVPDGQDPAQALRRTTHLGIGAHQDDLEFMAMHGILACYQRSDAGFGGITVTNGSGSAREGRYAHFTDAEMMAVRRREQRIAAQIGHYSFMAQLDYPSSALKSPNDTRAEQDIRQILEQARPRVVYTHNPADKHETHIAVMAATLRAIRSLPPEARPRQLLGCEVWRDLDWMPDEAKVVLDVGGNDNLAAALNSVFDSQIAGGKRYDLAVMGRRRANATFFQSHATDALDQAWFAMDLTPLVENDALDLESYTLSLVEKFAEDVRSKLRRFFPTR